jgi:pimeloyl-[acyl-carrier protein] methyl ester esterase
MNNQVRVKNTGSHYYFFIRGLIRSQFHWHQFPAHFERIAQQRSLNSTSVFFDIPGNGHRYQEVTPFSIADIADDIDKQIHHYLTIHNIDSSAVSACNQIHLVGISMGGMIAADLISKSNVDFASVHIINSSFANLSPFWQRMKLPAVINLMANIWQIRKRERAILKWTSNTPSSLDLVPEWIKETEKHPLSLRNAFAQLWAASHYFVDLKANANSVVYCSKEDRLVSWTCSQRLARYWQVPLECNLEAGHDLPLDNPQWLAKKIIRHSQKKSP